LMRNKARIISYDHKFSPTENITIILAPEKYRPRWGIIKENCRKKIPKNATKKKIITEGV
jgi:hypothetical protein